MEIKLQCPLKFATSRRGWHHELTSLDDLKTCITQGFGLHPEDYAWLGLSGHNGIDIGLENGDYIYAAHDGTANFQQDDASGKGIVITTQGFKTIYWHMTDAVKPLGSTWEVKKGDFIGIGDNTGWSTGPHLHFGLKLLDANGDVLNRDNGFDGAVDPTPYIVWWNIMTQEEVKKLYRLAFYRDPDAGELAYWTGKELVDFLTTAIKDRANFLLNT